MARTLAVERIVWAVCSYACGILLASTSSRTFLWAATLVVLAACGLFLFSKQGAGLKIESVRPTAGFVLLLLTAVLCGAWRMEWRESKTGASLLAQDHDEVLLSGRVVSLSGRVRGTRLLLEDIVASNIAPQPRRVSLRYWGGSCASVGQSYRGDGAFACALCGAFAAGI